jgi:hypothetical protein
LAECRREAKDRQGALLAVVLYAAASCTHTHRHTGTTEREGGWYEKPRPSVGSHRGGCLVVPREQTKGRLDSNQPITHLLCPAPAQRLEPPPAPPLPSPGRCGCGRRPGCRRAPAAC